MTAGPSVRKYRKRPTSRKKRKGPGSLSELGPFLFLRDSLLSSRVPAARGPRRRQMRSVQAAVGGAVGCSP